MAVVNVHVEDFLAKGCGCNLGENKSWCVNVFTREQFTKCRDDFIELSNEEKDMFLLSNFAMNRTPNQPLDRSSIPGYKIYGYNVCKKTFLYLLNISNTKYRNIANHYNNNGLGAQRQGNTGRLPINTTPFEVQEHVVSFIKSFARDNALPLPGRVPNHKEETTMVIPSSETKLKVWKLYTDVSCEEGLKPVGHSLFLELWNRLLPWIVIAKPSTDLCWTCQNFSETLSLSPNFCEVEKAKMVEEYKQHLDEAKMSREHYNKQIKIAQNNFPYAKEFSPFIPSQPCSFPGIAHYSWDYAQQLHYPTNPQQPGPIYFKTARKCGIFGIVNDGNSLQHNYLIDEAVATGKGANPTISYVHHYLQKHGMGETDALFHADNCSGK